MSECPNDHDLGRYGYWATPLTFVFVPPRQLLGDTGVSLVRSITFDDSLAGIDRAPLAAGVWSLIDRTEGAG